jgi:hypothetical protein
VANQNFSKKKSKNPQELPLTFFAGIDHTAQQCNGLHLCLSSFPAVLGRQRKVGTFRDTATQVIA